LILVIRGVDNKKLREFKSEAKRRGLSLSQALEEAIELWLEKVEADENNAVYEREKNRLKEYYGKYAVFAYGRLLGVYETLEDVTETLKKLSQRPRHSIVVRIGIDDAARAEMEWWGGSLSKSKL
jgi:hypothetical protein